LLRSTGKLNAFKRGVQPPKKDKDGKDVPIGAVVGLVRREERQRLLRMQAMQVCSAVLIGCGNASCTIASNRAGLQVQPKQ
jgi:hypothetical protein